MIDEQGYLFGVVNVIDALVLVVLAATVSAGLAAANIHEAVALTAPLVVVIGGIVVFHLSSDGANSGADARSETWYATLELGTQPMSVAEQISEGETVIVDGYDEPMTVVDVFAPRSTAPSPITIRAAVPGVVRDDEHERELFHFDDEQLLLGSELTLDLGTYVTDGTISALEPNSPVLAIEESTVMAEVSVTNVSPLVAAGLEAGMVETVRAEPVATITSVEREPATVRHARDDGRTGDREHPHNVDVTLWVELRTTETESGIHFRGERLEIGTGIALDFETLTVAGQVRQIDSVDRTHSATETVTRLSTTE